MNNQEKKHPQQNENIKKLLRYYNQNHKNQNISSTQPTLLDSKQQKRSGLSSVLLLFAFILYAVCVFSLMVWIADTNDYLVPLITCSSSLPLALLFHALSRILFLLESK